MKTGHKTFDFSPTEDTEGFDKRVTEWLGQLASNGGSILHYAQCSYIGDNQIFQTVSFVYQEPEVGR